jgi:hypothetical protein
MTPSAETIIATMARSIADSGRALADMRGIVFDLHASGFRAVEIGRHLDAAIARARASKMRNVA